MREQMVSRPNLAAAVFIGGMAGAELEHDLFRHLRPEAIRSWWFLRPVVPH